jgi:hypothetical protein
VVHEIHNHPMRYYPHLIHSMCWQSAMKAVKRQLQARGEKVMQFPSRDLRVLADEYLAAHRDELIEDAIGMVRTVPGWLKIAEARPDEGAGYGRRVDQRSSVRGCCR